MCVAPQYAPLFIAGSEAAQQLMGLDAQRSQANAQNDAIRATSRDNANQLARQGTEDAQNATLQLDQINRERMARFATAKTAAAGSGFEGLSVDAMLSHLSGAGLEAGQSVQMNAERAQLARQDQAIAIQRGATAQLSQVQNVGPMNYLAAGLNTANAYLKADAKVKQNRLSIPT